MSKFPEIIAYSIPAPSYKGKPKKMFPYGFEGRIVCLGDINKFVSIVYYCGRRGYKLNVKPYDLGGVGGYDITVSFGSKRQYTYFKKKFG